MNPPDMPKYKVSGTLSGKSGVWANTEIQIGVEIVTTDENGRYELDVYPGEHPVYIPGIADQETETVSVTDSNVEKDISLDYVRICGKLLHGGKPVGESDLSLWTGQDETWTCVAHTQTKEDGSYILYAASDAEYVIQFDAAGIEFDPVTVQQQDIMNQDLILTQTKVSGTILAADKTPVQGAEICFVTEQEHNVLSSAVCKEDGSYCVYLQPGTYNILCQNNKVIKEGVAVEDTDMTCNIDTSLYRVDVTAPSNTGIALFDEVGTREDFWCDENGNCCIYLENGTYTMVKVDDTIDPETKEDILLDSIDEDKKTVLGLDGVNGKVEIK